MTLRGLRTSNNVERDMPAILVSFLAAFQAFAIVQEFSCKLFSKINTEMTLRGLRTSNIVERDVSAILVSFLAAFYASYIPFIKYGGSVVLNQYSDSAAWTIIIRQC